MDVIPNQYNTRGWLETKAPKDATIVWYNFSIEKIITELNHLSNFVCYYKLEHAIDVGYAGYKPVRDNQWFLHFWFKDPNMALLSKLWCS